MPPAGFEPAIPASEQPQTHVLDRAATGIGIVVLSQALSPVLFLLNQGRFQLLRVPVSHCNTFHIMCDVPNIAVVCGESIECFPGLAFKFFFKPFVTHPVGGSSFYLYNHTFYVPHSLYLST